MVFHKVGRPLSMEDVPAPAPAGRQLLIRVHACGVCRTDLHIVDGELPNPKLPLVLGHQIVGAVEKLGPDAHLFAVGDRVGVPWLGSSCGRCKYCASERENLCADARYTGYQIDGGFAESCAADERFVFPIPRSFDDVRAAPLLCGGLIGYRAYRMTGDAQTIGFYGFGSAAHMLAQVANYQGRRVFAFVRPGDDRAASFARELGAAWAGPSDASPPEPLDAAIIFAPVGALVPAALRAVAPGGVVVCAGIHMSDVPSFPYSLLWHERVLRSVANLTRRDGEEFLALAAGADLRTKTVTYPLEEANDALSDLRDGSFTGSAVIFITD